MPERKFAAEMLRGVLALRGQQRQRRVQPRNVVPKHLQRSDRHRVEVEVFEAGNDLVDESPDRLPDVVADLVKPVPVREVSGPDGDVSVIDFVDEQLDLVLVGVRCCSRDDFL